MLDLLTKRWWWILVRGIAAILFGIACFVWPVRMAISLVFVFGVYAIIDGATMIVFGRRLGNWFWYALAGVVSMVAGVVAIAFPVYAAGALVMVIGLWAIFSGIFQIMAGWSIRKDVEGEWVLFVGGVLAILFGILVFLRPGVGAAGIVWLIGMFLTLFGILQVVLAFKLKGLQGAVKDAAEAIQDRMDS
jgi:uncharacterized membrane protein HdeD (DUF308 family)